MPFRWSTDGSTIRPRIVLAGSGRRPGWIGHVLTVRAIHAWKLMAPPRDGTAVDTEEWLAGWGDRRRLEAPKREAERRNGVRPGGSPGRAG